MNFKQRIDQYITREPFDDFTPWVEQAFESYSDEALDDEDFTDSEVETNWLNKLFDKRLVEDCDPVNGRLVTYGYVTPELAGKIISRAYRLFIKRQKLSNTK